MLNRRLQRFILKFEESTEGALILELSFALPIFILVIMFVYGMFVVHSAENEIVHALVQSSKSLSLDTYAAKNINSVKEANEFWNGLGSMVEDIVRDGNNPYFSSASSWYDSGDVSTVRRRFIGFFSGGDSASADQRLQSLGIEDGINGLKFELISADKNGDLDIKVSYSIHIWFDAFGLGTIPMEHEIKAKMW